MSANDEHGVAIWIESGISAANGQGFCRLSIDLGDGEDPRPLGQLTPDEVRDMALNWLGAAEAAEHDAAVFSELVENAKLGQDQAAAFVGALRERRADPRLQPKD